MLNPPFLEFEVCYVVKNGRNHRRLGPMATVAFMNSVLEHTPIKINRDHLHMIVDCNPTVPDINAAILGTGPSAAAALAASGRRLETAGADFIVMVCNAAHVYEDELRRAVAVPFISMAEETVRTIRSDPANLFRADVQFGRAEVICRL